MTIKKYDPFYVKITVSLGNLSLFVFHCADGHTIEDVIFMWIPGTTEVSVEHKEMAQFEYKGSKLELDIDDFGSGQFKHLWRSKPILRSPSLPLFHSFNLIIFHSFIKPFGRASGMCYIHLSLRQSDWL